MRVFDHLVVAYFLGPPCIAFAVNLPRKPSARQNEAMSAYTQPSVDVTTYTRIARSASGAVKGAGKAVGASPSSSLPSAKFLAIRDAFVS